MSLLESGLRFDDKNRETPTFVRAMNKLSAAEQQSYIRRCQRAFDLMTKKEKVSSLQIML